MSNPNNLIRPALLNNPAPGGVRQNENPPPAAVLSPQLEESITNMVINNVRAQMAEVLDSIRQPQQQNNNVDETIEDRYKQNIQDIDKIPDVVKFIKEFSGNANEFGSWKKSVERVLDIYSSERAKPRYYGIINVIRNKIVGDADVVLESYNTPLNWEAISTCLTTHYADKRDIRSLEYQLMSLYQGNNPVEKFYQEVYSNLSLILNKIACMGLDNASISLLTQTYRDKALDTFIRGLNGDLPRLLAVREIDSLPQALHLCQKLANQGLRSNFLNNNYKKIPPIPPRNYNQNVTYHPQQRQQQYQNQKPQYYQQPQQQLRLQQQSIQNQQPFYSHLAYVPQNPQIINNRQFMQNQSTNFQNTQQLNRNNTVEPMEVDSTLHNRRVNYMNRPEQNYNRPNSSFNAVDKRQRNFNISSDVQLQPVEAIDSNTLDPESLFPDLSTENFLAVNFLE